MSSFGLETRLSLQPQRRWPGSMQSFDRGGNERHKGNSRRSDVLRRHSFCLCAVSGMRMKTRTPHGAAAIASTVRSCSKMTADIAKQGLSVCLRRDGGSLTHLVGLSLTICSRTVLKE